MSSIPLPFHNRLYNQSTVASRQHTNPSSSEAQKNAANKLRRKSIAYARKKMTGDENTKPGVPTKVTGRGVKPLEPKYTRPVPAVKGGEYFYFW